MLASLATGFDVLASLATVKCSVEMLKEKKGSVCTQ